LGVAETQQATQFFHIASDSSTVVARSAWNFHQHFTRLGDYLFNRVERTLDILANSNIHTYIFVTEHGANDDKEGHLAVGCVECALDISILGRGTSSCAASTYRNHFDAMRWHYLRRYLSAEYYFKVRSILANAPTRDATTLATCLGLLDRIHAAGGVWHGTVHVSDVDGLLRTANTTTLHVAIISGGTPLHHHALVWCPCEGQAPAQPTLAPALLP